LKAAQPVSPIASSKGAMMRLRCQ
jgi:AcrR family transcriptional regulator